MSGVPKDCVERAAAFLREEPFLFRDEEPVCFSCGDAAEGCSECELDNWYYQGRFRPYLAGIPPAVRTVPQVPVIPLQAPTTPVQAPVASVMCSISRFPAPVPGTFFGVVCGDPV